MRFYLSLRFPKWKNNFGLCAKTAISLSNVLSKNREYRAESQLRRLSAHCLRLCLSLSRSFIRILPSIFWPIGFPVSNRSLR